MYEHVDVAAVVDSWWRGMKDEHNDEDVMICYVGLVMMMMMICVLSWSGFLSWVLMRSVV